MFLYSIFVFNILINQLKNNGVLLIGCLLLTLTACGGGGGGGEIPVADDAIVPIPVTGADSQNNPVSLEIDTNYSISIPVASTKYYKFTTGKRASTFTMDLNQVSASLSWTLYTDAGFSNFVDICNQSYDSSDCETDPLDANTTYYLSISQFSISTTGFTLRINQNISSEGSFSNPVRIEVGTPYEAAVGAKLYTLNEVSYYDFIVNTSIEHTISITGANTDLLWKLDVSGGGLYTEVVSCDEVWGLGDEICTTPVLNATTRYILRVENIASQGTLFTINVTEGGTPPADLLPEGSLLSPLVLTPDVPHVGTVSKSGINYYQFTTGDTSAVHIMNLQHVATALQLDLYTDSDFTTARIGGHYQGMDFRDIDFRTTFLDPNTTYYLKLSNYRDVADKFTITVLVDAIRDVNSEGTSFTPIPLTLDITHSGQVGATGVSYYSFTAPEAKPYLISTSNATSDLYWIEQKVRSLYAPRTNCNKVTGTGDESCTVYRTNVGGTYLIDVREYDGIAATFDILVTTIEGEGEGTVDTPVAIDIDTPYLSSLGASERSHYKFTTGSDPLAYRISVSGATSDTDWVITTAGSYSSTSCDRFTSNSTVPTADEICDTPVLLPNTDYLLKVDENSGAKTDITVLVSSIIPVDLSLDTTVNINVDAYTNYRYHTFTTDAINTDYTITINNATRDVKWELFDDAAYSVYNQKCLVEPGHSYLIGCTLTGLAPNTKHYIRTYSYKQQLTSDSYDIAVYADDFVEGEITPVALTLGVEHVGKMQGTNAGTDVRSIYEFTTTSGGGPKPHTIAVTGQLVGSVSLYEGATYITGCTMTPGMTRVCPTIATTPITLRANTLYRLEVSNYYRSHSSEFILKVDLAP